MIILIIVFKLYSMHRIKLFNEIFAIRQFVNYVYFIMVVMNSCLVRAQTYETTILNADNGLPQNSIKDIVKDKYGFIWLSTEAGIVRFDGRNIVSYDLSLSNKRFGDFIGSVINDHIFAVNEGEKNTLMINKRDLKVDSKSSSFYIFKNRTKYLYYPKNSLDNEVNPEANHFIKINNESYYIHKDYVEYIDYNERVLNNKAKLTTEDLNRIFGIGKHLFFLDKRRGKIFSITRGILSEVKCEAIFRDEKAKFYWSSVNNQAFLYLDSNLYFIYLDKNLIRASKLVSIPKNEIDLTYSSSIFYDSFYKRVYIGSLIKGLYILNLHQFNTLQDLRSPYLNTFYATLPFQNGILSPTGNIYYTNGKIKKFPLKGISDKYAFILDHQKNILYKSGGNLYIAYSSSGYRKIDHLKFDNYISFLGYENNLCIIGFEGKNGLIEIYSNNNFDKPYKTFVVDEEVKFVKFYKKDSLIIGNRATLYKASLITGKLKVIDCKNDFNIRNFFISKDNKVWVLTYGNGIFLLENNKLHKLPLDQNNFLAQSNAIIEDSGGFFWISTNNGMFKIKETELLRSKDSNYNPHYYYFDKSNGFATNEFNGGCNPTSIKLLSGDFAFPSLEGIVTFNPQKIRTFYPTGDYVVEAAIIDNKQRKNFSKQVILERYFNRATVLVSVPYYGHKSNLVIQAKFNKKGAKWENIGESREFTFTNLPYGNHELLFRILISPDGKYAYKKILITVKPYLYERWEFQIVIGSLIICIIIFIHRRWLIYLQRKSLQLEENINQRTFVLKKIVKDLQKTKMKLYSETLQQKKLIGTISHDITTPIKYLVLTTEMLYEAKEDDIKLKKKYLFSLHQYAMQLYKFTQTLKEYSEVYKSEKTNEVKKYSINDVIKDKVALFEDIAQNNKSYIINTVPEQAYTSADKNIISIIIHNLIDNAIKNTKNGNVYISYGSDHVIKIADEGIGMPAEKIDYYMNLQNNLQNEKFFSQKNGIGLHLVLQLAQMIHIKIIFEPNTPNGTIVKVPLTE